MKVKVISLLGALGWAASAFAAPGDIDPAFGTAGGYSAVAYGTDVAIEDAAVDASGRLLLAGVRSDNDMVTPFVVRTSANGVPDGSFGTGSIASPGVVGDAFSTGVAIAVSSTRIYLAAPAPDRIHVYAYDHAGVAVPAFGSGGHAELIVGAEVYPVIDIALQGNRVLLAAGARNPSTSNRDFVLGRLTVGGAPDTTFDGDGRVYARVFTGPTASNRFTRIALQADGKIVAAGRAAATPGAADAVLARFSGTSGALDLAFGSHGYARYDLGANDFGRALAIQADGRIVLAGGRCDPSGVPCRTFALRTFANGALDTGYGTGGVFVAAIDNGAFTGAIALDGAGRAVIAGSAEGAGLTNATLLRLTTAGQLDPAFGTGGIVRKAYASAPDGAINAHMDVVRDPQGRLVVAGHASAGTTTPIGWGLVARYLD